MVHEDEVELLDTEISEGWRCFSAKYPHNDIEHELKHFLTAENTGDWLRKARISSLLSIREMGKRLGMSAPCYHRLERRANVGDITLKMLKRCAEVLDCEVVYAIRPKSRVGFSVRIWEFLFGIVRKDQRLKNVASGRRGAILAQLAERLLYDPKFRKAQGWTKNCEEAAYDTLKIIEADNACRNVMDRETVEALLSRKIIKL